MKFQIFDLANSKTGMRMTVTNFGCRVISLWVPDRRGNVADVVLGYDTPEEYVHGGEYYGCVIGRVGNRIAQGTFPLHGKTYKTPINNGVNTLHSGPDGFHRAFWEAKDISSNRIEFRYLSRDGEAGFPGNLSITLVYTLTDEHELLIEYFATTDKTTIVNLTHHAYFNLAGHGVGDILNHRLTLYADRFTPINKELIPTGEILPVEGTPFDFRSPASVGARISESSRQLQWGKGYDHNWVLNKKDSEFGLAADVVEPGSGRFMEVWTTEPGLQFYSGNFLDGKDRGKNGMRYAFREAFCLEAQHFPDSPNRPEFPSITLNPGEEYFQKTAYRFGAS
jgi:aldose 1-epimerase